MFSVVLVSETGRPNVHGSKVKVKPNNENTTEGVSVLKNQSSRPIEAREASTTPSSYSAPSRGERRTGWVIWRIRRTLKNEPPFLRDDTVSLFLPGARNKEGGADVVEETRL